MLTSNETAALQLPFAPPWQRSDQARAERPKPCTKFDLRPRLFSQPSGGSSRVVCLVAAACLHVAKVVAVAVAVAQPHATTCSQSGWRAQGGSARQVWIYVEVCNGVRSWGSGSGSLPDLTPGCGATHAPLGNCQNYLFTHLDHAKKPGMLSSHVYCEICAFKYRWAAITRPQYCRAGRCRRLPELLQVSLSKGDT